MALTSRIANSVSEEVQARGLQYFRKGAVKIHDGDEQFVDAIVTGSTEYEVTLERKRKSVKAWCTCPYCEDHFEPCKHIWATFLAAQERGFLRGSKGEDPTSLDLDEGLAGDYSDDEWGDDDWDDADEGFGAAGGFRVIP